MKDIAQILNAINSTVQELRENFKMPAYLTSDEYHNSLKKLKLIRKICKKKYFDQQFYGNAALNRKILFDAEIAKLLTPATLLTLYLNQNSIIIRRNSGGDILFTDALYFGFRDGLEVLKRMPNNEKDYGLTAYALQQKQFEETTLKIVAHILVVAERLKINIDDEKFQYPQDEKIQSKISLVARLKKIQEIINDLKKNDKDDLLLAVPEYLPEEIRSQSLYGFARLCEIAGIDFKANKINQPDTLAAVIDKLFACKVL